MTDGKNDTTHTNDQPGAPETHGNQQAAKQHEAEARKSDAQTSATGKDPAGSTETRRENSASDTRGGDPNDTPEKAEQRRRDEAKTNPNKSVNDPDFNPDSKLDNPDRPAHTVDPKTDSKPAEDKPKSADDRLKDGDALTFNTTDGKVQTSKTILERAKLRVKEIDRTLESTNAAEYRIAVEREVMNLTNGNPAAKEAITKHWNEQTV